ncbi:hypothetical protein AS026_10790 [Rhizobium altiplani]|uniref:Uncharacterized protein n=1 Tax=Rhizobium altiplani TaxID=1864509 RepID=A0A109JI52_9HYPH|nr:hypothetical protein [Rhizobium altiplani]KWV49406.1 hypothetical protein AS026_10790 [Rhizobium altiplani]
MSAIAFPMPETASPRSATSRSPVASVSKSTHGAKLPWWMLEIGLVLFPEQFHKKSPAEAGLFQTLPSDSD